MRKLSPDRYFSPEPRQRALAAELYAPIAGLPLISPHGHVDPRLFAGPDYAFGSPVDLLILPDHYLYRMLYSQGIALERLGLPRLDGGPVEADHRRIWQVFAEHFHLFHGTPSGVWLTVELAELFDVDEKLSTASAQRTYDQIAAKLTTPEFQPRALFARFNLEVLCTTDAATDPLHHHQSIRASRWTGQVRPTFRPDGAVNLDTPGWRSNVEALSLVTGAAIHNYPGFVAALENRRAFFKQMGATATNHAALWPKTEALSAREAEAIFQRALRSRPDPGDAPRFTSHMLLELARMAAENGLVMQLHPGAFRNHNPALAQAFGPDKGADIPVAVESTRALRPLLERFGNDPRFRLIAFTLDETTYGRELAPLAGHYPALRLGPPWWFCDSLNGMARFFDQVMETASVYNTTGFVDDTRAVCSIPARHDLWRRASANWLAGLVAHHLIDLDDAHQLMRALAYDLAREAYRL